VVVLRTRFDDDDEHENDDDFQTNKVELSTSRATKNGTSLSRRHFLNDMPCFSCYCHKKTAKSGRPAPIGARAAGVGTDRAILPKTIRKWSKRPSRDQEGDYNAAKAIAALFPPSDPKPKIKIPISF
jgi:hypothetical protein